MPLLSTPEEWRQIEYILEVLPPIPFWTLWMSKTGGVPIHPVFQVYQDIFDHLEMQISMLERKRMQWKVDIREGLVQAKSKAASYGGKTECPRGLLFGIAICLNPYCKLNLFRECDLDASEETEYEKSFKKEFIAYYDMYYAPLNNQAPDMSIPRSGLNSLSKHHYTSRHRLVILSEALVYIETNSVMEPPEPDAEAMDPSRDACPAGIFYEANICDWWKVNAGRFPNLARMSRDILAVQGGSVGVERVFSMARDMIPYRRSQLKSSTIRSGMLVKSYENEELRRELAGNESEREAEKLQEMAEAEDHHYWPDRKEESIENDNGCISDDDESHKKDTEWSFVDQDVKRGFGREPKAILPECGLVESQYAWPGPPRNQGVHHLGGSEESDPEERIWDSTGNTYVVSDSDEVEGLQDDEVEIPGEGLSDLERIDQEGYKNSGCIAGSRGLPDEDSWEAEALSGTSD